MKKVLSVVFSSALSFLPAFALAAAAASGPTDIDVVASLTNITNWAFTLLLSVAGLFILFAAFNFVTAQGDPEKVKSARDFVLYALIGVIVALLSKGLISLVQKIVTPGA
ncbi:MAG: hypothetical protein HYW70_03690 [Candidatus Nealsonbacteria bacterium]|nr:hypothetical protein [Candidatus Nealsonbacteria bacterium]